MRTFNSITCFKFITFIFFFFWSNVNFAADAWPYNKIVFFGDSLTDNGNLYKLDFSYLPKSPPYFSGRFTNGYVWSDLVANYFEENHAIESLNFAIGGQTTVWHNPADGFLPYTLMMSIDKYLLSTVFTDRTTTLFIIWIGANDYLHGSSEPEQITTEVTERIRFAIERLISYGGKNFLIVNLPNLSKTPYSRVNGKDEILNLLSIIHNSKLTDVISQIEKMYDSINIHLFDVDQLLTNYFSNPEKYNKKYNIKIKQLKYACWEGGYWLKKSNQEVILRDLEKYQKKQAQVDGKLMPKDLKLSDMAHYFAVSPDLFEVYDVSRRASENEMPCFNQDEYFFWDKLHPSSAVHAMLSKRFIEIISREFHHF